MNSRWLSVGETIDFATHVVRFVTSWHQPATEVESTRLICICLYPVWERCPSGSACCKNFKKAEHKIQNSSSSAVRFIFNAQCRVFAKTDDVLERNQFVGCSVLCDCRRDQMYAVLTLHIRFCSFKTLLDQIVYLCKALRRC